MFEGAPKLKIEKWFRRVLFSDPDGNAPEKIVLRPLDSQKKLGTEIHTITCSQGSNTDSATIDIWIQEIGQIAYGEAEELGGLMRYVLVPYYGKVTKGRYPFCVRAEADSDDAFESEGPNKQGIISQLMRHNEVQSKTSSSFFGVMVSQMSTQMATLQRQNEELQKHHVEALQTLEGLISERHERDLQTRQQAHTQEIKEQAFKDIRSVVPVLVNKIANRKLLPEGAHPVIDGVKRFGESLRPEQINAIMKELTPPQQVSMMKMFEAINADNDDEEKPKEASTNGAG